MNLLDCFVTEILDEPYRNDYDSDKETWWLKVEYTCYGHKGIQELMFRSKDDALKVERRYHFLS